MAETLRERHVRLGDGVAEERRANGEEPVVNSYEIARSLADEAGMDVFNPLHWQILMMAVWFTGDHFDIDEQARRATGQCTFEEYVRETQPVK